MKTQDEKRSRKTPDYLMRAPWHDYNSRCFYLVTFTKSGPAPRFSDVVLMRPDSVYTATTVLSEAGRLIEYALSELPKQFPNVEIRAKAIMPDHVHVVVFMTHNTGDSLGKVIGKLKSIVTGMWWRLHPGGRAARDRLSLFSKGFNDKIVYKEGQLRNFIKYVIDNPYRYYVKRYGRENFGRYILTVPAIPSGMESASSVCGGGDLERAAGEEVQGGAAWSNGVIGQNGCAAGDSGGGTVQYEIYGNRFLLLHPLKKNVRFSRRYTESELKRERCQWWDAIRGSGVVISPFVHPREKEVREVAIDGRAGVVIIESNGLGERYAPKGRYMELCAEGRLLVIAPLHHDTRRQMPDRGRFMEGNRLALHLATLPPESMTFTPVR